MAFSLYGVWCNPTHFPFSSLSVDQSSGRSPVSPGFPQPLRFTPEGGPGKLRPVSNTLYLFKKCVLCIR